MRYSEHSESLKDNRDFSFVYRNGKSFANRQLVLYRLKRSEVSEKEREACPVSFRRLTEQDNRIGIQAGKKVGNSVVRHRLTRLVRESYRLNEKKFVGGLDLIVIVRPGAKELGFFEIERALLHVARKAGILSARGEYIGYVDGDDWIGPGFYYSLYASLQESGADVALAGFSRDLFDKRKNILNGIPSGVYSGDSLDDLKKRMISDGPFFTHGVTTYLWNKLFRREVILPHQLACDDSVTIGEDAAVTYPTLMDCKKVVITDNCAYHYRQREDSMLLQQVIEKEPPSWTPVVFQSRIDQPCPSHIFFSALFNKPLHLQHHIRNPGVILPNLDSMVSEPVIHLAGRPPIIRTKFRYRIILFGPLDPITIRKALSPICQTVFPI